MKTSPRVRLLAAGFVVSALGLVSIAGQSYRATVATGARTSDASQIQTQMKTQFRTIRGKIVPIESNSKISESNPQPSPALTLTREQQLNNLDAQIQKLETKLTALKTAVERENDKLKQVTTTDLHGASLQATIEKLQSQQREVSRQLSVLKAKRDGL